MSRYSRSIRRIRSRLDAPRECCRLGPVITSYSIHYTKLYERTVLVTGGCGFIGANLLPVLAERGWNLRVLDNLSKGSADYLGGLDVDLIEADILDLGAVVRAARGADAVIHLAAYGSVVDSVADPEPNFRVITSYSIHYTKLYDGQQTWGKEINEVTASRLRFDVVSWLNGEPVPGLAVSR